VANNENVPLLCEVCKGTGTVYAFMNGRNSAHPCPRGCNAPSEEAKKLRTLIKEVDAP